MEVKYDIEAMVWLAEAMGHEVKFYNKEETYEHQDLWTFVDEKTGEYEYFFYPHGEWEGGICDIPRHENCILIDYRRDCTVQTLANDEGEVSIGWY